MSDAERLRVLFIHGKESSPHGKKGQELAQAFDYRGDQMDTDDFSGSVALQARAIAEFQPDVVVGSSYGGAVLCELLQTGHWSGPTLLLAPAARLYNPSARLPADVPVVIVHGLRDEVVPIEHSRALVATRKPQRTWLHEVDDDHRLTRTVSSGRLIEYVRQARDKSQAT